MSFMLKTQANNVTKKIFKLIKDFKDLKEKQNEISVEETKIELEKLKTLSEKLENDIDIVEEEIDKLVVRNFVDCQDDIVKSLNNLSKTNSI